MQAYKNKREAAARSCFLGLQRTDRFKEKKAEVVVQKKIEPSG